MRDRSREFSCGAAILPSSVLRAAAFPRLRITGFRRVGLALFFSYFFHQDQFGPAFFQFVFHLVKSVPDQVPAKPTRLDGALRATAERVSRGLLAIITQPDTNAPAPNFHREENELIVLQGIGISNNIRAGLVDSQDHEKTVFLRKRMRLQEGANPPPDKREIATMTGELECLLIHTLRKAGEGKHAFKS